ncbi:structural protein [Xenorhabdus vietnamensis]|uniref:Structural protein n=1 Tax=Xenorhabdus vietnamensis TaxID=351656 RepID=A0A1Y2S851_9GAMM|nr:hypothetical protein [Xenorhabdus vietnamensis]OTA14316.1 structural protein [Xenorhabdus vietnamensis]
MANAFDFEINADENATKVLAEIEARIKGLQPVLNSTREGLRFGGSETLENTGALSNQLRDMSRSAQDNVQNIGDMIPPLKNFGELFTKYSGMASKMGLLGGIGGVIGGLTAGHKTLRDMGKEAYNLDVLSKNTAMSIEDSSSLIGAMVQIGTEAEKATDSVQNLFNTLNAAERGENGSARAELDKLGVKIHTTKGGSADVIPTLLELEKAFKNKNILSETENRLIVKLGLTPEILALLREGKIQERLDKSVKNGQSRTAEENQKLTDFNTEANEVGARIDGMWNRTKIDAATWFLDKGKEAEKTPAWQTIKDIRMRESDTADNFYHGNKEKDIVKRAIRDKEFISQLTFMEEFRLLREKPDENLQKKLNDRYGESWEKQKKAHEAKTAANKTLALPKYEEFNYPNPLKNKGKPNRSERNNNPGNLRDASNTIGRDGPDRNNSFVKFRTMHDGLAAMSRQLMLYGDRGINTLNTIIPKYAPKKDNNDTFGYIDFVSKRTGINPNERLNMHDPALLERIMKEMIFKESEMQFSPEALQSAIMASIHDPRWAGLRSRENLQRQRLWYEYNPEQPPVYSQNRQAEENEEASNKKPSEQPTITSLYSQDKRAEYDEEMNKRIALAVQEAIGDKTITVDINLFNDKTGERQNFQSNTAGKVTTSMRYP